MPLPPGKQLTYSATSGDKEVRRLCRESRREKMPETLGCAGRRGEYPLSRVEHGGNKGEWA